MPQRAFPLRRARSPQGSRPVVDQLSERLSVHDRASGSLRSRCFAISSSRKSLRTCTPVELVNSYPPNLYTWRLRSHEAGAVSATAIAALDTSASGEPRPHDRLAPAWLLSVPTSKAKRAGPENPETAKESTATPTS